MSWMKERDSLIAQTMAFVQSVTGRREDLRPDLKPVLPPVEVDVRAELATALEIVDAAERPPVTVPQPRQVVLPTSRRKSATASRASARISSASTRSARNISAPPSRS